MKEVKKHNPVSASSSQGMLYDLDEASGTNAIDNQIELRFEGMFSGGDGFAEDLILRAQSYDYTPRHDIEDFNELENVEEEVMSETCQGVKQRRWHHHRIVMTKLHLYLKLGSNTTRNGILLFLCAHPQTHCMSFKMMRWTRTS